MIGDTSGTKPIAVFGLSGTAGALTFLFGALGIIAVFWVAFLAIRSDYGMRARAESEMMKLPKIGSCIRAFAMSRLCTALQLTMGAGMSVLQAVELSLRSSGNLVFVRAYPLIK